MAKVIIPTVGSLYAFRLDNTSFILGKYKYYYSGLLMCVHEDLLNDVDYGIVRPNSVDQVLNEQLKKNPIYGFEVYNCKQYHSQLDFLEEVGLDVKGPLFLTLSELNDMILPANEQYKYG